MQTNQTRPSNYMQALDQWTEKEIIEVLSYPLLSGSSDEAVDIAADIVKKAVRAKVLESYRNGQTAGPVKSDNRKQYAKR
jgi:hypothetical protein